LACRDFLFSRRAPHPTARPEIVKSYWLAAHVFVPPWGTRRHLEHEQPAKVKSRPAKPAPPVAATGDSRRNKTQAA